MYLVSIYFDEKTNQKIKQYIEQTATKTGNTFMTDGNVPPHITVGAFETKASEKDVIKVLQKAMENFHTDKVQLVSIGTFQASAIFLSAVYSEYLHEMCECICEELKNVDNTLLRANYQPFQWMPHVTIGKTLSKEQIKAAFEVLQDSFRPFTGTAVKIGLAKTNPYRDIAVWALK